MENARIPGTIADPKLKRGSDLPADLAKYQGSYSDGKQPSAFTAQKERRAATLFHQQVDETDKRSS